MSWTRIDDPSHLPSDNRPVLAVARYRDCKRVVRIRAQYVRRFELEHDSDDDFGEYHEEQDNWYWPEGWYEWNEFDETNWFVSGDVTHWMELPPLPEDA